MYNFYNLFLFKKKQKKIKIDRNLLIFYFFILIIFFEWLYNHPSLRYGGYIIIFYIFMLPYCIFINKYNLSLKKIKRSNFFYIRQKKSNLIYEIIIKSFIF